MSVPSAVRRLQAGLPAAQLRHGLDSALHLFGFAEPRADRLPTGLTIQLGPEPASPVTLVERLGGEERTYRFEAAAGDPSEFAERVATIVGGRGGVRIKVLVDPAACFIRSLDLPSAALPRMRAVLTEELEATTPFRAASVYSDWFVEGEDTGARTLRVRHVVIKRARLDPLLDALAGAGLSVGPAAVGRSEDQTMPVDLLSHGHRTLPALFGQGRKGDALLLAGAALLMIAAFWGWRSHQEATLTGLNDAFAAARRAAGPPPPPPVQAGIAAILSGRAPPLVRTWDALAAALPAGTSATDLHLDHEGALVTLVTRSEDEAMAALWRLPGLGPPVLRGADDQPEGTRRLVVHLPGATR